MEQSKEPSKEIPLETLKDKLPEFEEKKELYKLRHYLHYHVVKKKKAQQTIQVIKEPYLVKFD
jgi:hypothetical protein